MHFLDKATPTNIGIILSLAVIILICWRWFAYMLVRGDEQFKADSLRRFAVMQGDAYLTSESWDSGYVLEWSCDRSSAKTWTSMEFAMIVAKNTQQFSIAVELI